MWQYVFGILLFLTSLFLVLLVLVQRGRGGGLAGAFGGMGGQSAFGTKAGDLFTKVTVGVAAFWILLCVLSIMVLNTTSRGPLGAPTSKSSVAPADGAGAAEGTEGGEDAGPGLPPADQGNADSSDKGSGDSGDNP